MKTSFRLTVAFVAILVVTSASGQNITLNESGPGTYEGLVGGPIQMDVLGNGQYALKFPGINLLDADGALGPLVVYDSDGKTVSDLLLFTQAYVSVYSFDNNGKAADTGGPPSDIIQKLYIDPAIKAGHTVTEDAKGKAIYVATKKGDPGWFHLNTIPTTFYVLNSDEPASSVPEPSCVVGLLGLGGMGLIGLVWHRRKLG